MRRPGGTGGVGRIGDLFAMESQGAAFLYETARRLAPRIPQARARSSSQDCKNRLAAIISTLPRISFSVRPFSRKLRLASAELSRSSAKTWGMPQASLMRAASLRMRAAWGPSSPARVRGSPQTKSSGSHPEAGGRAWRNRSPRRRASRTPDLPRARPGRSPPPPRALPQCPAPSRARATSPPAVSGAARLPCGASPPRPRRAWRGPRPGSSLPRRRSG